jgi:hypothetical protein
LPGKKRGKVMKGFAGQVELLKKEIRETDDSFPGDRIEEVATRLEGLNFSPPVITPLPVFLRMDRQQFLREVERIEAMPDSEACALAPDNSEKCEDLKVQYITVLLYYYRKLLRLRGDVAEEWDEVDELYVHD